jgi:protein TonB
MSTISVRLEPMVNPLTRFARLLACSLAIHFGLGALVVAAGALGMAAHESSRVVWLDLEPAEIPPAAPAPPPVVSRPRPLPAPVPVPRKPVPQPALDEPVMPPPAPPVREVTPEPPPATSVASVPPNVAASFKTLEPEQGGASSTASPSAAGPSTGAPIDAGATGVPQERGSQGPGKGAIASRPPDAAPGGPIVRAARPKGGYQVRPVYPESARRAGIQGTTLLRIHIETDGRVSEVTVERSAGNQSLDQAAADAVRRWRFEPALNSAGPVAMSAVIPVVFRMDDRD